MRGDLTMRVMPQRSEAKFSRLIWGDFEISSSPT